jgi:hypothetical protein
MPVLKDERVARADAADAPGAANGAQEHSRRALAATTVVTDLVPPFILF